MDEALKHAAEPETLGFRNGEWITSAETWRKTKINLWRSTCGRYTITRTWLPGPPPRAAFTLHGIDPASTEPHAVGRFLGQHSKFSEAQQAAERDVRAAGHASETSARDDLVTWLREQIAEDRRLAEAANGGPWHVNNETFVESIYSADDTCVIGGGRWGGEASVFDSNADALHIARHDPRAVLAQCDAHEKLLDLHPQSTELSWLCELCGGEGQNIDCAYPCDTLRVTALAYQHHPGFREEWRSA